MYRICKRFFDFVSALIVLVVFLPVFVLIAVWIALDSKGGIFYSQVRVGKDGCEFKLLKFRTMRPDADKAGQLTIGNDSRITRVGRFLRKTKLDEFPQLINILKGEMSVVGPRPEVPRYVSLYSDQQRKVLSVRPGLTDYASLEYFDEQKVLGSSENPEKDYIQIVMPHKLELNLRYIEQASLLVDIKLIFRTFAKIVRSND